MIPTLSEGETISAGQRVEAFLADPAVSGAFARLGDRYVADLRAATDAADILQLHAKLRALADVERELRATKDAGTRARTERDQRERREQQTAARSRR